MAARKKASDGWTDEEREAMKERARETKKKKGADEEPDVLAKIAEMQPADRAIAEGLHALAKARGLQPKTWYGMPAYAKDGKTVCFFQAASRFKSRYATLGFSDNAALDDGALWATSFAVLDWSPATEERVAELVRRAVGG